MSRELHSADGTSYIDRVGTSHTRWTAVFQGKHIGSFQTREDARVAIRAAKGLPPPVDTNFNRFVDVLEERGTLTRQQFDILCRREGLDPKNLSFHVRLAQLGWVFNQEDPPPVSRPLGRWRLLSEGWLNEARPVPPPTPRPFLSKR